MRTDVYQKVADALRDDARALKLQHSFCERVAAILPDRWTITRSRVVAYANMIDYQSLIGDGHLHATPINYQSLQRGRWY